jgi:putative transposase
MPRKPRFFISDIPVHVVQRGNNKQSIFFAERDYGLYLDWLQEASACWDCAIHAYVLMTNHVHLLTTPAAAEAVSRMMQTLGRRYVQYVNRTYHRSGTLWEGRFKSSLVQQSAYLLACYRYIELNPVRAGIVAAPEDYRWSSYRHNALGAADPLITGHADYRALGATDELRRAAYRELVGSGLEDPIVTQLRGCVQTGTPFGNDRFRAQVEQTLGCKVGFSRRGRPRRPAKPPADARSGAQPT